MKAKAVRLVWRAILLCVLVSFGCGRTSEPPAASSPWDLRNADFEELSRVPELGNGPPTQILPPSLIRRDAPYADHVFPRDWLAEAPSLRAIYPAGKLQNESEDWHAADSGWLHTYGTNHWVGAIDAAFFSAFEERAAKLGFRRTRADRFGQVLTLEYSKGEARIQLVRDGVFEVRLAITIPVGGSLPPSSLGRALAERPRIASATRELGARLTSAHLDFGRWHFVFESRDPHGALGRQGFVKTECHGGIQKWDRARPSCWRRGKLFSGFKHGRLVIADEDSSYPALQKL